MSGETPPDHPAIPPAERSALERLAWQLHTNPRIRLADHAGRIRALRELDLEGDEAEFVLKVLGDIRWEDIFDDLPLDIYDPPQTCPIPWRPTIFTPVFWGREHVTVGAAATPVSIYYPSLDGSPDSAQMLRHCGQSGLILFLHGHCQAEDDHVYRWERVLAQLARCGFVVAAPYLNGIGGGPVQDSLLATAVEVLDWMRASWAGRDQLMPSPHTGVFGHSYGGMLACRVATTAPVRAYAGLSAGWHEWSTFGTGRPEPLPSLAVPSLHMWGTEGLFSDEVTGARWAGIPTPKHRVILHGAEHWEYLQGQSGGCAPSGASCRYLGSAAGDLVAAFFARYLEPDEGASVYVELPFIGRIRFRVPPSLRPPQPPLTLAQQFFDGGHLMGLKLLPFAEGCEVTSGWETGTGSGSVTLGDP
jgi:pimeloyl-ACP methyl ester carboxylesterase